MKEKAEGKLKLKSWTHVIPVGDGDEVTNKGKVEGNSCGQPT